MCRGWERPSGSSPSPLVVSAEADQILFAGVPHQHPQHPQHQHGLNSSSHSLKPSQGQVRNKSGVVPLSERSLIQILSSVSN